MKGVRDEYLEAVYTILVRLNLRGKVATPQLVSKYAHVVYPERTKNYAHFVVNLDRALRKLPEIRPDVKRISPGKYVIKELELLCSQHVNDLRAVGRY